jgi:hypothetical protein
MVITQPYGHESFVEPIINLTFATESLANLQFLHNCNKTLNARIMMFSHVRYDTASRTDGSMYPLYEGENV